MFKVTNEDIEKLVDKEYEGAIQYGLTYNSDHEFISVLREEVEEVNSNIDDINYGLSSMWVLIKCNKPHQKTISRMEMFLIEAIKECLQCLAVIKKYKSKEE